MRMKKSVVKIIEYDFQPVTGVVIIYNNSYK